MGKAVRPTSTTPQGTTMVRQYCSPTSTRFQGQLEPSFTLCCLLSVKIWSVVDLLRAVDTSKKNHVDRFLSERILSHIMKLNSICSDSMGILHTRIHPFKSVGTSLQLLIVVDFN